MPKPIEHRAKYRKFVDTAHADTVRQMIADLEIICVGVGVYKTWTVFGLATSAEKSSALEERMREAGIEWKIRKPRTSNAQIFAALPKKPKHTPWYRPNTRIECPHCEKPTDVPAQEFFYQYSREYTCTECGKRFEVFIDIMALEK